MSSIANCRDNMVAESFFSTLKLIRHHGLYNMHVSWQMNSTVEMFREAAEAKGRDRFSCSVLVWNLLQQIGVEFGWDPQGSAYVARPGARHATPAGRDYQPGDATDFKQVSAEDAMAWASALEASLLSPRLSEILTRDAPATVPHDALISIMREFTEYCYGGAFVFAMK